MRDDHREREARGAYLENQVLPIGWIEFLLLILIGEIVEKPRDDFGP